MPKESESQKRTIDRVMHEYKHGELKSGPGGKAGKVTSQRQAVAIALSEAGASNQQSPSENRQSLSRAKEKERKGETAMQESEGRSAKTRRDLEEEARRRDVPGRSKMSKAELERALQG
jgi:hypothetical protein